MMNICNVQSSALHVLARSFHVRPDELGRTERLLFSSSVSFISLMASRMPLLNAMEKHPPWLLVCLQELLKTLPAPSKRANHNCDTSQRFASST